MEGQNATGKLVVCGWNAWKAGLYQALDGSALGRLHSQFAHGLSLGKSIKVVALEGVDEMQLCVLWNKWQCDWSVKVRSVHGP